ncbi:MAG: cellulase family glycosylhydrolase [Solirubrobacterales bacterium]
MIASAVVLISILVASSAATGSATAAMPRLKADPDVEHGGRIVDSKGREVLLRGVNVNSLGQYWKGTDKPSVLPFDKKDPKRIAGMGWNVVRLIVSWSKVEPQPGKYNEAYLDRVERWVNRLGKQGVYTIIDFHQDAWGPALAARPGEPCVAPAEPGFGWDGAPGWATIDDGQPRCFTINREVNLAVTAAWNNFFANTPAADGIGIQTHYARTLRRMAKKFARSTAVAGIDIMNEPGALGPVQTAALGPFYARALAAIRAGEKAGKGFRHLVLFEPSVLWSLIGSGPPPVFAKDRNLVYSPHLYGGSIGGEAPPSEASFVNALEEAKAFGGAPVLTGEWGGSPDRATGRDDDYFNQHQALQDKYRIGATLWTWKQSCGDPHAATHDPGSAPPLPPWSLYEMNCSGSKNKVVGQYRLLRKDLRRAYVRRAPGRLNSTSYSQDTGIFQASGKGSNTKRARVEIFFPMADRRSESVRVKTNMAWGYREVGRGMYLIGKPGNKPWSIRMRDTDRD